MTGRPDSLPGSEIHKRLDRIDAEIGKGDPAQLHRRLDEIFQYKPVDSHYFLVRGRLYLWEKRYHEAEMTLAAKTNWWMPDPYAPLLAELLYEIRKASGSDNPRRIAVLGHYTYLAATTGWNRGRKVYYHEDFVQKTENIWQEELLRMERLEGELLEKELPEELSGRGRSEGECTERGLQGEEAADVREICSKLSESYYIVWRPLQQTAAAMAAASDRKKLQEPGFQKTVSNMLTLEPNIGYFIRRVLSEESGDRGFLLVASQENRMQQYVMARFLRMMGCRCRLLELPVSVELDAMVDVRDTVEVSLSNREEREGIEIVYPCALYLNGGFVGDNVSELVDTLVGQTPDRYMDVLADYSFFSGEGLHCLTEYKGQSRERELCFGYAGDYASYLGRIFACDYRRRLERKAKCRFSVIVPARNSAYTLRYTLRTCLNQRNMTPGEYEVIVSDNSDRGNTQIEELVREIGDDRVKYYRTPMVLPLAKSFEYAYGLAEGEYILTLGSDDGAMPWCLETLREMIRRYPNQKVIGWVRGYFQWTESRMPQKGKLVIPDFFRKGQFSDGVYDSRKALKDRMDCDSGGIYATPVLYINSAFRRDLLPQLLEQSGSVLDSYTQDLGMGIKSLLLAGQFVHLRYPLTVAGVSDGSLGGKMIVRVSNDTEAWKRIQAETERGIGNTVICREQPCWPITTTEGMFWAELFRLRSSPRCDALLRQLLEGHDWKRTLQVLTGGLDTADVGFSLNLEKVRYNAYCFGEEIGRWYDREIYHPLLTRADRRISRPADGGYETGFVGERGLTLDAGQFGANTVEEAVELFARIVNL